MRSIAKFSFAVVVASCLFVGSVPQPAVAAGTPGWLVRFNNWRASSGVPALTENTTWDQGDVAHSQYMVKNDQVTHYEVSTLPYYSVAGDTAAKNGNIQVSSTTAKTDDSAIDWWMAAPFHAMGMMDPRLTSTGFGSYREVKSGWQAGFTLDTLRGNSFSGGSYPVFFPGNGATVPATTYSGNEFPDPLQACPGYSGTVGLPLFIEVGGNVATTVTAHSFTGNGVALAHCAIDSNAPNVGSNLTYRGGVIVIPQQPLLPRVKYVVVLTVNGVPYTWSFGVTNSGSFAPGAPTSVTATAGDATATVTWTPPVDNGGTPITSYTVTAYVGSTAQSSQPVLAPATSTTFFGLTNGTTYSFSVTASNASSSGPAAYSNAVTPKVPPVTSTKFLLYPTQALGTTSGAQTLTLTNASVGVITVSAVNLSGANAGEFTKGADTCSGQSIALLGTCTVQYTFTPIDNGVRNATVTFVNNGPNNPTSALVGVGGSSQAATRLWFTWYDLASAGVNADTIHITNPSGGLASGTITLGGGVITFNVGPGQDSFYSFPGGTIGGPVVINSTTVPVIASLRAWYYQSFNETPARSLASAATVLYLPWYDLFSPGMRADTIHITNVSGSTATGTIALPGAATLNFSVNSGQDSYYTFPQGTIGGPVTITSSQPVLATLRAWYYQSFNETSARPASAAATTQYFPWYDLSSPGMQADTIHITNESGAAASGTIALPGAASIPFSVPNGQDSYFAFPGGSIGGPVKMTSNQPVLASLRAWYYQSFNEVPGRPTSPTSATQYFPWYDLFSPGVKADTIHITNPGGLAISGTISRVGSSPISFNVAAGQDVYFAFSGQPIGGPVTISANGLFIASLRAWYYQSFNEVPGSF